MGHLRFLVDWGWHNLNININPTTTTHRLRPASQLVLDGSLGSYVVVLRAPVPGITAGFGWLLGVLRSRATCPAVSVGIGWSGRLVAGNAVMAL